MSNYIRDIQRDLNGRGERLDKQVQGAVELAYMRGFTAGYLQAMKDEPRKRLKKENSQLWRRAEPKQRAALRKDRNG